jgi:hypothetical protein
MHKGDGMRVQNLAPNEEESSNVAIDGARTNNAMC